MKQKGFFILKKRRMIIAFSVVFLFLVFLFRHSFIGYGAEMLMRNYFPASKVYTCKFEKVRFKDKQFIFQNLSLTGKEDHAPFQVHVQQAKIGFSFSLIRFDIRPKIYLHSPEITYDFTASTSAQMQFRPTPLLTKMTKQMLLEIQEGVIHLKSREKTATAYFAFEQKKEKNIFGSFRIADQIEKLNDPPIEIALSSLHYELLTHTFINDVSFQWLADLMQVSPQLDFINFSGKEGIINGSALAIFSQKGLLNRIDTKLEAINLKGEGPTYQFSLKNFFLECSYPGITEGKLISKANTLQPLNVDLSIDEFQIHSPKFSLENFGGIMQIGSKAPPKLTFKGFLQNDEGISLVRMKGVPYIDKTNLLSMEVLIRNDTKLESDSIIDLAVTKNEEQSINWTASLHHIDKNCLRFIMHFLPFRDLDLIDGTIDGSIKGEMGKKSHVLQIQGLKLTKLDAIYQNQHIKGKEILLSGELYNENKAYQIPKAFVKTEGISVEIPDFSMHPLTFSDGSFYIEHNEFSQSYLVGKFGGCNFNMNFSGDIFDPRLSLFSSIDARFIEDLIKSHTKNQKIYFPKELFLNLSFEKAVEGHRCFGKIEIEKQNNDIEELSLDILLSKNIYEMIALKEKAIDFISKGTIKGNQITHSFYQLPISYLGMEFSLFGDIDIHGEITNKGIDFTFASNHIDFVSQEVDVQILDDVKGQLNLFFDSMKFHANIPVNLASCQFKPNDLSFEKINGILKLNDDELFIDQLQGYSKEGIFAEGQIYLHFDGVEPDFFDLHVKHFKGYANQFTSFAMHFPDFPKKFIDIDGYIRERDNGLRLQAKIGPDAPLPDWSLKMQLEEGMISSFPGALIKNFSFDFDWDSTTEKLLLSQIQFHLSPGQLSDHYHLVHIPELVINHIENPEVEFDLRISNDWLEIARIVGSGKVSQTDQKIDFELDNALSSLFGSKCNSCLFSSSFGGELLNINADVDFSYQSLIQVMHLLSEYHYFPQSLAEQLLKVEEEGKMNFSVRYGEEQPLYVLGFSEAKEEERPLISMMIQQESKRQFLFQGRLGEVELSTKIENQNNRANLFNFSLCCKDSFAFSDHGYVSNQTKNAMIELSTIHIEIDQIKHYPLLKKFFKIFQNTDLFATVDGNCLLKIHGNYGWSDTKISGEASFTSKDMNERGFVFNTEKPLLFEIDESTVFRDISIRGFHYTQREFPLLCGIEKISTAQEEGVDIKNLNISMAPEFLQSLMQFSDLPLSQWIHDQKWLLSVTKNHIEASLDLKVTGDDYLITGKGVEGYYWIGKRMWKIMDYRLSVSKENIKGSAVIQENDQKVGLEWDLSLFAPKTKFQFQLFDISIPSEKISVQCHIINKKPIIQRIEGNAFGLFVSLFPKYAPTTTSQILTGKMNLDVQKLQSLFPQFILNRLKDIEIGKGYELIGDLFLDYDNVKNSFFEGNFKGRDFEVLGYGIRNLMTFVKMGVEGLYFKDLRISDESGVIWMSSGALVKKENGYEVDIPKIEVSDFRPSLLFKRSVKSRKMKPFIVTHGLLENLKGPLNDLSKITGKGNIKFINTAKREVTILDVPLELISRLGLDLKLLIPIKGELDYKITNQQILFTELKDSVSEGKRSHFFLSKKRPSYIDFDGNMQIDIKMKQHVLLKITQPFTLSIRGSVFKPQFSLK